MSFYVDFSGIKGRQNAAQGKVHSVTHGNTNVTPMILALQFQVLNPRDVSTGQASGRRQHNPIKIVKEVDPSSPALFNSIAASEVLREVKLIFSKPGPDGKLKPHFTVTLTNAQISGYRLFSPSPTRHSSTPHTHQQEEIALVFQKILVASILGGVSAQDDWQES